MKPCTHCGTDKPLTEFYLHPRTVDGRTGRCKACTIAAVRQRRAEKLADVRAYDRERNARPERRELHDRVQRRWRSEHPERCRAALDVRNALRAGRLVKPATCERCPATRVEAHHEDYSQPLVVDWLCRVHHAEADKRRREVEAMSGLVVASSAAEATA